MRRAAVLLTLLGCLSVLPAVAGEPAVVAPAPTPVVGAAPAGQPGAAATAAVPGPRLAVQPEPEGAVPVAAAPAPPIGTAGAGQTAAETVFGTEAAPPAPARAGPPAKPELTLPIADLELPRAGPAEQGGAEELNLGWTLIRTFVVLGFVILAIYITLNFGLRRLMGISAVPRGQAVVQVVERIPLDQKRAMFVVKAAGEYLLIGGGDGSLQLIAKLDPAEVEKLQEQRPPAIALSPLLLKLLRRRDAVPAPRAPGDNS